MQREVSIFKKASNSGITLHFCVFLIRVTLTHLSLQTMLDHGREELIFHPLTIELMRCKWLDYIPVKFKI